jgi:hypothetical protein
MKFALFAAVAVSSLGADPAAIQLHNGVFRAGGWRGASAAKPAQLERALAVYAGAGDVPPMLGTYRAEGDAVVFIPKYPLQPGVRYRAVFSMPEGAVLKREFEIPRVATPTPRISAIYPSVDVLPENQLKFYIHFSASMQQGRVYQHLHLYEDSGNEVELPFLELEQELWDPEGKRLTVLFDPGRIKRGLVPHNEVGPAILTGRAYTFVIDGRWRDVNGEPLGQNHRKPFRVGPADRIPPDPKDWRVIAPSAGAGGTLDIEFPEPMDHALALRLIEVLDAAGKLVAGDAAVDRQEHRWRFTPRESWRAGDFSLRIGTALEDLAGNRLLRPFEVDVFERIERQIRQETVLVPFHVNP